MAFDIDQKAVAKPDGLVSMERHVFVSGLARAGTTILMRRFYATGAFCSLTYRDMPFVLAPNIWRKATRLSKQDAIAEERAHGDRIMVDFDSPESLDEVFWRIFDGDSYIAKTHLAPHVPDDDLKKKFASYVNAIIQANDGQRTRYLSKNNNNILRLRAIRSMFPNAIIVVPFRHPIAHAGSLLRQHIKFVETQTDDRFVLSYMSWLGHHEFGLGHRPFRFGPQGTATTAENNRNQIAYWLELWRQTYEWLEQSAPADAIFVSYEDLCQDTAVWTRIAELAGLDASSGADEPFRQSDVAVEADTDSDLARRALDVHGRLMARARASLR